MALSGLGAGPPLVLELDELEVELEELVLEELELEELELELEELELEELELEPEELDDEELEFDEDDEVLLELDVELEPSPGSFGPPLQAATAKRTHISDKIFDNRTAGSTIHFLHQKAKTRKHVQ